jgi:hypothetical protein
MPENQDSLQANIEDTRVGGYQLSLPLDDLGASLDEHSRKMRQHYNPFVSYLNRYTTVSPEHEAAFDEFITQSPPPSGKQLRLETKIEQFVRDRFSQNEHPPSIILTGNAGDGKTYLCRQIIKALTGQESITWTDKPDYPIETNGFTLRVVKDLSEVGEEAGVKILQELAHSLSQKQPKSVFLIAANEGRLRALLSRNQLEDVYRRVDPQLHKGTEVDKQLIVINLNQTTTSTYVPEALQWLTDPVHWQDCQGCPALNNCPIHFNATRLADTHISQRLKLLYQVLENLSIHVTIRDMLIHLTYTLTSGLDCETLIKESSRLNWEAHRYVYYKNVWGEAADEIFRRKAVVIQHLRRLKIGKTSVFDVDDFIINGQIDDGQVQTEYSRLFAPALDLGGQRFEQERKAYLQGGASSPRSEEELPLIAWLPHCRCKLFFEWQNVINANRLFSFLFLPDYFRLIEGDPTTLKRYSRELILGLNRAFSGLYLTDANYLYVTSEYAHAVEQPVPIVQFRIATDYIDLRPQLPNSQAFDDHQIALLMEIHPPPRIQAQPIRWSVDLLRFEYLMRRARGGTPNVLATECELVIRQLKDRLLSNFAANEVEPNQVTFFAADRNRYTLQTLRVDDQRRIRM